VRKKKVKPSPKNIATKYSVEQRIFRRERIENTKEMGINRIKIFAIGRLIRFIPYLNLNENKNHPKAKDKQP
jgi:hypothetical protein